jgi:hypothetical protein
LLMASPFWARLVQVHNEWRANCSREPDSLLSLYKGFGQFSKISAK